ncbi:MAG: hypothetical protein V4447_08690 [Pseudomonadota bacterium]
MKPSKNNLLHHHLWLRKALKASNAEAILDFDNFEVHVRREKEFWTLYPQFLTTLNGVRQYTTTVSEDVNLFAGWLPYQNKHWPIAADKLAFKDYANKVNLPAPLYSTEVSSNLANVIVKRLSSSFGAQILGPFKSAQQHELDLSRGEYYERFVRGRILKIWYWNAKAICLELDKMPTVRGNGTATVGELIINRASQFRSMSEQEKTQMLKQCSAMLDYFDINASTVLEQGKHQPVEFRYGSDLMHATERSVVNLQTDPISNIMPILNDAGIRLQAAIPAMIRKDTLFTVDAILDKDSKPWFLEMNSNPAVHPYVYPAIVASVIPPLQKDSL